MPYKGEFASYSSLRRIVESAEVQSLLQRSRISPMRGAGSEVQPVVVSNLPRSNWLPDFVLAVDGSCLESPVNNGYPLAALGYVTVASVMLDVAKLTRLDVHRPIDPRKFRELESVESIDGALPGSNVVIDDEGNAVDSFRRGLYELLQRKRMAEDGETLLDTYEALLQYKPLDSHKPQQCPYEEDDCLSSDRLYVRGHGEYKCHCLSQRTLFSTDALRIHEFMQPYGSNQSMFTETMSTVEHIWIVHILRTLEKKGWLRSLKRLAIVLDGPLAVFGAPAWLSSAISQELMRINTLAQKALGDSTFNMLLIGVEKTGAFVEHFTDLDRGADGHMDAICRQSAILLTDQYIKQRIVLSDSKRDYGRNTYFGRKVFYKTASGALIVANIPFLHDDHRDIQRADISQFPRLTDVMGLLDKLASARYPNSVSALISAHAEAAIPLHLGTRVLEKLAYQLMQ